MGNAWFYLLVCGIGIIANSIHLWKIHNRLQELEEQLGFGEDESEDCDG